MPRVGLMTPLVESYKSGGLCHRCAFAIDVAVLGLQHGVVELCCVRCG
jgi:hypothetical protein